jgi:uncharacterized protein with von Willebrand factor type A (vWA) domain
MCIQREREGEREKEREREREREREETARAHTHHLPRSPLPSALNMLMRLAHTLTSLVTNHGLLWCAESLEGQEQYVHVLHTHKYTKIVHEYPELCSIRK